jgi:anti-sigma regulatory factor (Ser/Thr protein kinase)
MPDVPAAPTAPAAANVPREGGRVLCVAACAASLRAVRDHVRAHARDLGATAEWTEDLVLAVDEACQNIIRHGYGCGRGGPADTRPETCRIIVETVALRDREPPSAMAVRLTDFANPVDAAKITSRDLNDVRPGGLGVHFIQALTDDQAWLPAPAGAGNVLRLVKRLPGAAAGEKGRRK